MERMIANRYMVVKHIGQGGMADVYVAVDTLLNREVAVKILRGELCSDPIALLRFQREAQASCSLIHPNIVEIYDVGEENGRHYIVMEYIRGKTLKQLIHKRGALLIQEAVDIMKQLVSATCEAHKKGIIHRDIKPQNVLVKDDGTIKMVDFGIALAHDAMQLTQTDSVMGSVHYLAPELARGENATFQSDIYSLGIVFYELLSGEVPFHGDSPVQIALKHMRDEIPSIRTINPTIPQSVENIILKATVKRKELRYHSAEEMLKDLNECLEERMLHVQKLDFETVDEGITKQTRVMDKVETERKPNEKTTINTKPKEKKGYALVLAFALSFVGICGLIVVLIMGSSISSKNKMVFVPSCLGYTVNECSQLLEEVSLGLNTSMIEYRYTDDVEEGKIIALSPNVGDEVEKGTQIRITVSSGMWKVMQDYTGYNVKEATGKIKKEISLVKVTTVEESGSNEKAGTVLRQEITLPGDKYSPKSTVEIRLVYAAYPNFQIPHTVIGMNIDEAKNYLESMGAEVMLQGQEKPQNDSDVESYSSATVIQCEPQVGTWYTQEEDTYITLTYYY